MNDMEGYSTCNPGAFIGRQLQEYCFIQCDAMFDHAQAKRWRSSVKGSSPLPSHSTAITQVTTRTYTHITSVFFNGKKSHLAQEWNVECRPRSLAPGSLVRQTTAHRIMSSAWQRTFCCLLLLPESNNAGRVLQRAA